MLTEKENCLIAFRGGVPEWIPLVRDAIAHVGFWAGNECGIRGAAREPGVQEDVFGCPWDLRRGMPTPAQVTPLLDADDIDDWRSIVRIPQPESWDWEMLAGGELANYDPSKVMVYFSEQGCFDRLTTLMGFEGACIAMLTEPEACRELIEAIADYKIELIRCVKKHLNPDVFMYTDDIADATGLIMSPQTYRELLKPAQARIIAEIKAQGMIAEQHTCGNASAVLEDFVEIGVEVFFPAQACNDIPAVKRRFGNRLAICGGFDSQGVCGNPRADKDIMYKEAERVVRDCAAGGAFIFAPTLLDENGMLVEAMDSGASKHLYEAFLLYGKDFYKKSENRVFPQ